MIKLKNLINRARLRIKKKNRKKNRMNKKTVCPHKTSQNLLVRLRKNLLQKKKVVTIVNKYTRIFKIKNIKNNIKAVLNTYIDLMNL